MIKKRSTLIIVSLLITILVYIFHTSIGVQRNDFLSSDEAEFSRNSLEPKINLFTLRVKGEGYHPFFSSLVQNAIIRITGADYMLMGAFNYFLFFILSILLFRLSYYLTNNHIVALPAIILLSLDATFVNNFLIQVKSIYQTNTILTVLSLIVLLKFISNKDIITLSLFMGISTLNILTMETGILFYFSSIFTTISFLTYKSSFRDMATKLKEYVQHQKKWKLKRFQSIISINIIIILVILINKLHLSENVFPTDTASRIIATMTLAVVLSFLIYAISYKDKKYSVNIITTAMIFITQLVILLVISQITNFPKRAVTYIIPISFILSISLIYNSLKRINSTRRKLKIISASLFMILMISAISIQFSILYRGVIERIDRDKEKFEDFKELINALDSDNKYLSYSSSFRSYSTKDVLNVNDARIINLDNRTIKDSYSHIHVNLHNINKFKIIIEKTILNKFWERIDTELECKNINETEYHLIFDCKKN
ncbi:MAG: hypothetical protein ACOCUR_01430 [Nanoarchaeota archaeon]